MVAAVAHIHPVSHPKHPLMLDDLAAFRATMPRLRRPSAELLREARNRGCKNEKRVLYFDTRFLVPIILPEATSDSVAAFVHRLSAEQLTVSHWTKVEFSSLIAREVRMGTMVIFSTISRLVAISPLRSFGSTGRRNKGAFVSSLVKAQILIEPVASKPTSWAMTTGRGLPA
jgi:hypothetical protein